MRFHLQTLQTSDFPSYSISRTPGNSSAIYRTSYYSFFHVCQQIYSSEHQGFQQNSGHFIHELTFFSVNWEQIAIFHLKYPFFFF